MDPDLTNIADYDDAPDIPFPYEEKCLGDHVTDEQSANIANMSFKDISIGNYWNINNIQYRIMSINQFYNYNGIITPHVVVMPDSVFRNHMYNKLPTNDGGYLHSDLKNYIGSTYNSFIRKAFGKNHILSHTHDLTSSDRGKFTLAPTRNVKAWLINSYNLDGSKYLYEFDYNWQDADKTQFPAFKYSANLRVTREKTQRCITRHIGKKWWLGTPMNTNRSTDFCVINAYGNICMYSSDYSYGIRPAFLVY